MREDARSTAVAVWLRVTRDQAYLSAALSSLLDQIDPRERGLSTELSYGVIRTEKYLRRRLSKLAQLDRTDPFSLGHLLVAAYQIEFLDRVPPQSAVHLAVARVKAVRGERVAGFVNAVLRKLSAGPRESSLSDAILESVPAWLTRELEASVGQSAMKSLFAPDVQHRTTLRVRRHAAVPAWVQEEAEPVSACPRAFRYTRGGDPRRHAEHGRGDFVVQELGAQLVAYALGVQPGDKVFDVCAGRGQKTEILAEQAGDTGFVVATDLYPAKLGVLAENASRFSLPVETLVWDFENPIPEAFRHKFDRVLVDAPCTGVGTLRRRPEILRRLLPHDPERMMQLQTQILRNAEGLLRSGGSLLFSTCSVLAAEGPAVVRAVSDFLAPEPFGETEAPAVFPRDASDVHLLPLTTGTDGYFVARLRSRR